MTTILEHGHEPILHDEVLQGDGANSVLAMLDAAVRRCPDSVALRHGGRSLSYRELDLIVNTRAGALLRRGLAPQEPVALVMATGIDYITAMLAVLRAGGAYIPLAPALPAARISRMLELASCTLALVDMDGALAVGTVHERIVCLTLDDVDVDVDVGNLPLAYPSASQLACILFTSGSTGDPKGVRTLHGNLASYADWSSQFFAKTAASRVPLTAAPSYAAATSQIYACLCAGGTLDILDEVLGQPARLLKFFVTRPECALHTVPTVWRALLDRLERGCAGRPAALFLSGEHLPQELVERTFAFDPTLRMWNLYGPTEAVANISAGRLKAGSPVVIGQALPGSRLFVVDDDGRELNDGEEGRLLISGPGVCPGYLGDVVNEQFFDLTTAGGIRTAVYDTGDRARRLGADIQLLGRRDGQIKLRGVRIELAEIETNLLRHPDVAQAAVLLALEPEPHLVAFVQVRVNHALNANELQRFLRLQVPAGMLPERWSLQTLPQLPNGKIDRAALRARLPSVVAAASVTNSIPDSASFALEGRARALAALFARALGVEHIGLRDDFFALGGNSLKVYALLAEIEETFGGRLSFAAVYSEPTVEGLARLLPTTALSADSSAIAAQRRLSQAQRGLWLQQQAYPQDTSYNLCYRLAFSGDIEEANLRDSVARLCARHALLRCEIEILNGEPVFREQVDTATAFSSLDLASLPESERDAALEHALHAFANEAFASDGALLHRWQLIRMSSTRQVLVFVVHHLIFDGVSASLLFGELYTILEGRELPPNPGDYFDFVTRQARYLDTPMHAKDLDFWSRQLDGVASQPHFPVRYKPREVAESAGARLSFKLPSAERGRLADLASRENVSLHVLLLTAFAAVLDRYGPGEHFLVAVPFANRLSADDRHAVGYFTSLLFYRLRWQAGMPLRSLAASLREDTIALLDHQRLPFPELAALLRERLGTLPSSTFRLMFGYHDTSAWRSPGMQAVEYFGGQVKCDQHLECFDDGSTLELVLSHRFAALDVAAAQDWFDGYQSVLMDFERWLDLVPEQRPALTDSQTTSVLRYCRGDSVPDALTRTLPDLFAEAKRRYAQSPAVWHKGEQISYAELAARVASLVMRLRADVSAATGPIGICMPHQPALLVALLACAECGFPYVPLDPSFPPQRIVTLLEQAGARLLLAGEGSPDFALPPDVTRFDLTREVVQPVCDGVKPSFATPDSLLYIIYTSGSTGMPKGVMVSQRGVTNYLSWMQRRFSIDSNARILAKTSISFDVSTWELLLPLISGGCVVLASRDDAESPEGVARVAAAGGANVLQFVPSGLSLFVEAGMLAEVPQVRRMFCGGEALPPTLVTRVFETGWRGELYNLYGPTEASIFMAYHACDSASPYASVPIGQPIQNASLYVLDNQGRLLPPNVAGDLHIGGAVLADGYWRDREKTRDAFIDAPPGLPETRLYRTGDKGRLLSDGSFEYLGRDDQQLKIRGYRVELVEIEQHLRANPKIFDAVAFARHWGENDLRLHAAVVMRDGAAFDAAELSAWFKARLPAWMLPSTLSCLSSLPRLPNGKTDFHSLRNLVTQDLTQQSPSLSSVPRGSVEQSVAGVWRSLLGHSNFGLHDSFFDAGGHSMLLLKLRELLRDRMGVDFTIAELYKAPNVSEQALAFRRKSGQTVAKPVVAEVRARVAKRKPHQPMKDDRK
ncbi:non-ribosomal peptide synthetase [Paraburkholderia humisilvae]|uniref:Tyrocidine synthase 3 n=1 Tax=Paraburkholderia humisilvae TaxID=627669 RepID=A0A6J5F2Q2_9BURK|nr:non-ribosomal peptide synthetase [Paraburkholderia humisilvae]CAB3773120.1 Tyrocidine synthase 3 [Paraburkholderia humisilvae]